MLAIPNFARLDQYFQREVESTYNSASSTFRALYTDRIRLQQLVTVSE